MSGQYALRHRSASYLVTSGDRYINGRPKPNYVPSPAELYIEPGPGECVVHLSRGYATLIDARDFENSQIGEASWSTTINQQGCVYAVRKGSKIDPPELRGKMLYLHRLIAGLYGPLEHLSHFLVDHKNSNTLDNKRLNLAFVTVRQNNQSGAVYGQIGYRGVCERFSGRRRVFQAACRINGEDKYLGIFENPRDAAIAYDDEVVARLEREAKAPVWLLGRLLNFPDRFLTPEDDKERLPAIPVFETMEDIPF